MSRTPEYVEGTEAWTRFQTAMGGVLKVSKEEMNRRIEAERVKSAMNPNRRGPKRKPKA